MPIRFFTAHPRSVGESYFQHLVAACRYGLRMIGAGLACIAHGLAPFLFKDTGSKAIRTLYAEIAERKDGADSSSVS